MYTAAATLPSTLLLILLHSVSTQLMYFSAQHNLGQIHKDLNRKTFGASAKYIYRPSETKNAKALKA